jgi:hypothetical protein
MAIHGSFDSAQPPDIIKLTNYQFPTSQIVNFTISQINQFTNQQIKYHKSRQTFFANSIIASFAPPRETF